MQAAGKPLPAAQRRAAGRAAPFLIAGSDNSIPTYGTEAPASRRAAAGTALSAYLAARAKGDWRIACSFMGSGVRRLAADFGRALRKGKAASCAKTLAALSSSLPSSASASPTSGPIVALRVKGTKAFALFYGHHRQKYMMQMVSEAGAWKVEAAAPVAYPIGSRGTER